jgi:adenylylsulfate kinase
MGGTTDSPRRHRAGNGHFAYRAARDEQRRRIGNFLEVWVHAPLEVCESRDHKGIYRRARAGELRNVTGIDDPHEHPRAPDVECRTDLETLEESVAKVLQAVERWLAGHENDSVFAQCGN